VSGAVVSEKTGIDYTALFHILSHVYLETLAKKVKRFGKRDADNEILRRLMLSLGGPLSTAGTLPSASLANVAD
jgi:hypothetical protein